MFKKSTITQPQTQSYIYIKLYYNGIMEIETTVFKVGDSWVVRIPASMAEHFQIKNKAQKHFDEEKDRVKIKDLGKNKAVITFPVW